MNKDFARGMIVSMALKALPVRKKSPIAYLYNGVRLPALPEWDREAYPYAYINYIEIFGTKYYTLYFFKSLYYGTSSDGSYNFYGTDIMTSELTNGAWGGMTMKGNAVIDEVGWEQAVWTNVDILYEDGSVWLAASTPIPIYNEPVNYLYNGVKLPKLPEWDKAVYPYAYICDDPYSDGYNLWFQQTYVESYNSQYATDGTGKKVWGCYESHQEYYEKYGTKPTRLWYEYADGNWVLYRTEQYSSDRYPSDVLTEYIWANVDIVNADTGDVDLAASEPVPIYE